MEMQKSTELQKMTTSERHLAAVALEAKINTLNLQQARGTTKDVLEEKSRKGLEIKYETQKSEISSSNLQSSTGSWFQLPVLIHGSIKSRNQTANV